MTKTNFCLQPKAFSIRPVTIWSKPFFIYRDMKNIDSFSQFQERSLEPIEEKKGPCWKGFKQVGLKNKNGKMVPNCVPEKPKN